MLVTSDSDLVIPDIQMCISASTVKRHRKEMELHGSGSTMKTIDPHEAEQLIVKALDKDPAKPGV